MTLINIKDINYIINDKIILDSVSFDIEKKDIVTIIGPNGAGKSTLLKIIAGILKQTRGDVLYNEKLIKGYVPQNFFVDSQLPVTVRGFLKLLNQNIDEVVHHTKIENIMNNDLCNLSGGETKKVLLARALIKRPTLLFLDEPTMGLDVDAESDFYNTIADTQKKYDCTIVMVSHDLHMVMANSSKVICLNKHICCMGSPSDVMASMGYLKMFNHKKHTCNHGGDEKCCTP